MPVKAKSGKKVKKAKAQKPVAKSKTVGKKAQPKAAVRLPVPHRPLSVQGTRAANLAKLSEPPAKKATPLPK